MTGIAWWSQTAAANASSDSTVGWAEGQAPSTINDSARAMMASTAKWRDDISGAIVTAGTSTAYTVASNQNFDSLSRLSNQMIAFTPHTTNGATVTLNVDSLGAKPLRSAPSVELPAGTLVQGTPYVAVYNNSDGAFYLQGFFANPYSIPIGGFLDYGGTTAPNSSFVLAYGQAISRTTYSTLFSLFSTTYGNGDGSTTFNVPDLRGRVIAGKDDMGGSAASRITSAVFSPGGTSLGAVGGAQSGTIGTSNLPPYTPSGSVTSTLVNGGNTFYGFIQPGNNVQVGGTGTGGAATVATSLLSVTSSFTGTAQGGTSAAFSVTQPTIVLNKLLRIV
ncbi:phage tail protein [Bradyrhizobium sp. GCM10023182]|uniref:Phage tail protein n=1 Tax=Bradyrhizobium zhengyangense TaxID=2911009 RepID=A0ABS9LFT3_9BRAD|nr:tail fiber protein [Bradyrhizobium zhengyangense]MCG2665882.1 phage tail protein [Bradyrhizobium zhengyangense]